MIKTLLPALKPSGKSALSPAWFIIWVSLSLLVLSLPAKAAQISAQLEPTSFSTDEPATLTVTITGQQSAEITIPPVDGLTFQRLGQNSQFQMINGAISSSVTYTYLVQGARPGNYTIPEISTIIDGTTQKSQPISCTVTSGLSQSAPNQPKASGAPSASPSDNGEVNRYAYINIVPKKQQAYLGEVVPVTIKAYFRKGIRVNLNTLPILKSDSVLLDSLSDKPNQQDEQVNDTPYTVLSWDSALTGVKEGTADLSLEANATLLVRSRQNQRLPGFGGSIFDDDLFDDFFNRYQNKPIRVTSVPVRYTILPLPLKGRPEDFSGAVGSFSMKVEATPRKVQPGEPISLRVTIDGSGNFDSVSPPTISESQGLKTYSPTVSFDPSTAPHQGRKIFEQAVIATDPKTNRIPPVIFSFFEPSEGKFVTLYSDPITFEQSPAVSSGPTKPSENAEPRSTPAVGRAGQSPPLLLAPVRLDAGQLVSDIHPIFLKKRYLASAIITLMAIVVVLLLRLHRHLLVSKPQLHRQQTIRKKRRETRERLERARLENDPEKLGIARQELQNLLSFVWDTRPATLTTANIRARLGSDSPITELFNLAEQSVYGAQSIAIEESSRLLERIIATLDHESL